MGSGAVDSSQWLSVKEETIFLHDGLIRVTDLAELPSEIGVSEQGDTEQEVGESHLTHTFTHKGSYIETHAYSDDKGVFLFPLILKCVFTVSCITTLTDNGSANVCKFPALTIHVIDSVSNKEPLTTHFLSCPSKFKPCELNGSKLIRNATMCSC